MIREILAKVMSDIQVQNTIRDFEKLELAVILSEKKDLNTIGGNNY